MARKTTESMLATASPIEFGRMALRMPIGRPTNHAINIERIPISALMAPRLPIVSAMGSPRKNEVPRSPLKAFPAQLKY